MLKRLKERIASWFRVQRRMYSIYCELGYVPWRKPARPKTRKKKDGTYLGGRELIPFMNDYAKRSFIYKGIEVPRQVALALKERRALYYAKSHELRYPFHREVEQLLPIVLGVLEQVGGDDEAED